MHTNQTTLENFYAAFARRDADTMAACYAPNAVFDDEVFSLRGHEHVTGMWRMLSSATKAKSADVWNLTFSGIEADTTSGKAHWEADYRFSATGRMVHNVIDGVFEFNDQGLITRHRDSFDFYSWTRQALGRLACCWAGHLFCATRSGQQRLQICKNSSHRVVLENNLSIT